jgi:uncharacterized protein YndB with AHSA1/START domain
VAEKNSDTMTASERELVITRVFDAPRDLVWKAWTEPERIKQWSAPKGFTIPVAEGELRPGGAWKSCMRKPDGTDLWLAGVYREIDEPQRLVFTHAWLDQHGDPGPETLVTVTLAERGAKTEMTFRQSGFDSADSREGHAGGWNECFDRLGELLARG